MRDLISVIMQNLIKCRIDIGRCQIMLSNKTLLLQKCLFITASLFILNFSVFAEEKPEQKVTKQNANSTQNSEGSGFIFYGNWCGPNHPPDIADAPAPIDLLDSQCKAHDFCYFEKGDFDCSCDRAMVKQLDQNQKMRRFSREQYLLAQNMKIHFALSPCNGEVKGNKALPTRVLTNVYQRSKSRVLSTYDHFIGNRFPSMKRNQNEEIINKEKTINEDEQDQDK